MTSAIAALAFAVDLGAIYQETRKLQGIADAAALSAAAELDTADASARAAIAANGWSRAYTLSLQTGLYRADPTLTVNNRFVAQPANQNAARVTIQSQTPLYFGVATLGRRTITITRSATAARTRVAAFSIGSRLAGVSGGIANALLSGLTGSEVSLTAMDYNALLGADVDLFAFLGALRTSAGLQAVSFDTVLKTQVAAPRVLGALATALDQGGGTAAATVVRKVVSAGISGDATPLGKLIDLGPIGGQDRAASGQAIRVSAFDLMRGALELSNGTRQLQLDLGADVPGLAKTTVHVATGERAASSPWLAVTPSGQPIIRTSQTRLFVESTLLPGGLSLLGVGAVRLPVYVELAEAQAKLAAVACDPRTGARTASLDVQPSLGHVSIAEVRTASLNDHRTALTESPARIASALFLSVTGQARVNLTGSGWKRVDFTGDQVARRTIRTIDSGEVVNGLVTSLVRNMALNVSLLGLGISVSSVTSLVGLVLTPAAPVLDGVIDSLTGLLGIHIGSADVRIDGVRCSAAALVA
ncbi:Uncharacterized membrane protein [Sphingomonas jatrophae]|uniref:Uncharacterized membrane protein n=2 Tax=Sphingomonas jatrophae TaxID=1166337 RepID=A0A1I6JJL3_9SPHN|nr:Uncharacterized membrane protein [Sphingomonas jatrophae]